MRLNYFTKLSLTPLTVLVDYFGQEITDALAVAEHFRGLSDLVSYRFALTRMVADMLRGLTHNRRMRFWSAMPKSAARIPDRR